MVSDQPQPFSIIGCYSFAWKSFSKWWIPLCIISGAVFITNILPRLLTKSRVSEVMSDLQGVLMAAGDDQLMLARLEVLSESVNQLAKVTIQYSLILLPFAMLFSTLLLLYATFAVYNKKNRQPVKSFVWVAVARLTMAIIKGLGFLFFFFPGVYLYVKLFFVPLFMFEKQEGMWQAMKSSWKLTEGHFMDVMVIVLLNILIQGSASATVIGVIPVFGFTNTVRAAAFRMMLEGKQIAAVNDGEVNLDADGLELDADV